MTIQPTLTVAAFAQKWHGVTTTEKAGSQEHFIDLCRLLGEPTPHEADPVGSQYAFEKRVAKAGGGDGFADVWKRDFFAWEYKGKDKDLKAACVQLLAHKDDLGNPPLLVVSDIARIEIHTNFTGLTPVVKIITLTNRYNQRPTWLDHAHATLDAAVFTAYGWPPFLTDTEVLERLLALNGERAAAATPRGRTEVIGEGGSGAG